ncbi:MAG: ATP-binding protein [Elainellaceae cyanobacterium]
MFQAIRDRLLLSYLAVLATVLTVLVVAVRVTFVRVLNHQLTTRLETLGTAAALDLELDRGDVEVDNEQLVNENQAIEWFDRGGNLLDSQGDYVLTRPFAPNQSRQTQRDPYPAVGLIFPVNDYGKGIFIGYVRVSESTQEMNNTLRRLDLGLGGSVLIALILSGVGGLWLTQQAMQPIEQSFQRLQRFTSDAAHELRSPLAAIKANAAVALKYPDNIRVKDAEKFEAIASAATQLTALTESLLTLARTDQRTLKQQEMLDLSPLFAPLIQLYHPQFEAKGVRLNAHIPSGHQLSGNLTQLNRLFTNLIDNALRNTPSGGTVSVSAEREGDRISVSITDTGIGIDPDHLKQIFDRFWQVDQARSYQAGGFGLGLAIAQNIARNHG